MEHAPGSGPTRGNAAAQGRVPGAGTGRKKGPRTVALPDKARFEGAFGADFSDVRVFVEDDQRLSDELGARAYTDGQHIHIAEGELDGPGARELLAHELAHAAQAQRRPGAGAAAGVDRGGAAEAEAEVAAKAALRGEQVSVQQAPTAAVHRAPIENPREHDPDPTDDWLYVHRDITLEDGYATDADGVPAAEHSRDVAAGDWSVIVHATKAAPLVLNGSPHESQLFTANPAVSGDASYGEAVDTRVGSVGSPNVMVSASPDSLYIGGQPTIDDIKQGGVGDCYFLAALSNITASDPKRILNAVQPAGANVAVNLHEYKNGVWQPHTITTDRTALHWMSKSDPINSPDGLIAAGARVADAPVSSEWYVEINAGLMQIYRQDLYEMALWAPILEKAYAMLAQKTDQYGGGPARDTPKAGRSGYEKIEGGWEDQVYPIFYGADCVRNKQVEVQYTPGADLVATNLVAIRNLLRVMGQEGPRAPADTEFMLTVDLDRNSAVDRMVSLIGHIEGLDDAKKFPTLMRTLGQLKGLGAAFQAVPAAGDSSTQLAAVAKACARNVKPGAWPLLENPHTDKIWNDLYEHLNIMSHLGTDASNGQRGTYADHAYVVMDAAFRDSAGADLGLTQSTVAAQLANIDSAKSTVNMRNPHHTNEPNLPTSTKDADTEDGLFSMSLDQYLRSFSLQEIGRVKETP